MKKMFLLAACFMAIMAAHAQTVTQKQLQGKWKLTGFVNQNGTVDIATGTWKLKEGVKGTEPNTVELYQGIIAQAKDAVLEIKGETASQVVGGEAFDTSFSLEDKNGNTYITMDNGTTGAPRIYVKDGQMHVVEEDPEVNIEMIYTLVK